MLLSFIILVLSEGLIFAIDIDFNFQKEITEGEKHYAELEKKMQTYGHCWKVAISNLHIGCKQLTEDIQSRLALSFTNCFLIHTGHEPCACADDVPIRHCLKNSDDRLFNTYREFFTHTQNICHYLQHRLWQEEASETVLLLTEYSRVISEKMDDSAKHQSQILHLQQAALSDQRRLISNSKFLSAELQRSRESARDIYNEFISMTQEQKLLIFQVFDKMKNLQNFVLGEFSGVYTAAYYIIAASLIYILTSVPRTSEARIWLILIITINAIFERILALQDDTSGMNSLIKNELFHNRLWLCRKTACSVCFIILIVTYFCYKNYNVINNQLLREIQQQNIDLQNFIKGMTFHENIQTFPTVLKYPTKHTRVLFEASKHEEAAINTASTGTDIEPNNPRVSSKKKVKRLENKENSYHTSTPINSTGNAPKVSLEEEESNLLKVKWSNSPITKRYNLRRSSRLSSPFSSSYYEI